MTTQAGTPLAIVVADELGQNLAILGAELGILERGGADRAVLRRARTALYRLDNVAAVLRTLPGTAPTDEPTHTRLTGA